MAAVHPRLQSAIAAARRAIEQETAGNDLHAIELFRNAAEDVLVVAKDQEDAAKAVKLRERANAYIKSAEVIKQRLEEKAAQAPAHVARRHEKTIVIEENATGFDYESVFHDWMQRATAVTVKDPFIQRFHQCQNFLRLCELLVRRGKVRSFMLVTKHAEDASASREQTQFLNELSASLDTRGASLIVEYNSNLHDRSVEFNNGWVVRLGRGLDYFKPVSKFVLGYHDYNMRPCKECNLDVLRDETLNKL